MLKSQRKKNFEPQRAKRAQRKAKACGGFAEKTYNILFLFAAQRSVSSVVKRS
jgi:hypothetical protein